jgi:hypothetical protein
MRALLFVLVAAALMTACNNQRADEPRVYSVSEFVLQAEGLDSTEVTVMGLVDHICMGTKAKIHFVCPKNPDESIKIFANDELEEFSDTLMGKVIKVTGMVAVATRIDVAYLDEWEMELKGAEEGYHHDAEGEEEHSHGEGAEPATHHHGNQMALIAKYRKQIEESGRGYINLYKIIVSKIEPVDQVDK